MGTPLALLVALMLPHVGEHVVPFWVSVQLSPPLAKSFLTMPVNGCVALSCTLTEVGDSETVIAVTAMLAEADFVESSNEVAVIVTFRSVGGTAGAVYVVAAPLSVEVGDTMPHEETEQDTAQLTPFPAGSLETAAVKDCVPFACTAAVVGEIVTLIGDKSRGDGTPFPQPT